MSIKFDNDDEELLFNARESWVPLISLSLCFLVVFTVFTALIYTCYTDDRYRLLIIVALGAFLLVLLVVNAIVCTVDNLSTQVAVSTRRFYYRRGLLNVKDHVCDLSSITDVTINPSILGRIFDYANVKIQTKAGEEDFDLRDIQHAYNMRKLLNVQRDKLKVS